MFCPCYGPGEIDLALTNDDSHFDLSDIEAVHLFVEPMLVALPHDHPLARRRRVRLAELAHDRWMLGTTTGCPHGERFIQACHATGFDPNIAFHRDNYSAILGFVAAGLGVAPVPEMVACNSPKSVAVLPLRPVTLTRPLLALSAVATGPGPPAQCSRS